MQYTWGDSYSLVENADNAAGVSVAEEGKILICKLPLNSDFLIVYTSPLGHAQKMRISHLCQV